MQIIEETTALGVPFCHFKTITHSNQYNITFTKGGSRNQYEVHLIPLNIKRSDNKVLFDKDLRTFVCDKIYDFINKNNCEVYFSLNCVGLGNEYLLWKFIRWIDSYKVKVTIKSKVTISKDNTIRFFEFHITK
jgi:hypothetical protein